MRVTLQVFDSPEKARELHRAGVRRLLAIAFRDRIRDLERSLAKDVVLGPLKERRDRGGARRAPSCRIRCRCCRPSSPRRVEEGRSRFTLIAQEIARTAAGILAERAALEKKLNASEKAYPQAAGDVKQQLAPPARDRAGSRARRGSACSTFRATSRRHRCAWTSCAPIRRATRASPPRWRALEQPFRRESAAARAAGRRDRGVRAVRLAARGAARVAVRAGAEDAGAGVGQAPGQTLADSAPMNVAGALLYGFAQPAPSAHALADGLADAGVARVLGRRRACLLEARSRLRSPALLQQWLRSAFVAPRPSAAATVVAANVVLVLLLRAARLPDRALHPRRFRHAEDGGPRRAALVPGARAPARRRRRRQRVEQRSSALGGMAAAFR